MYELNKQHGRGGGDEALRIVGRRLRKTAGSDARVYRLGGDEFTIVQHDIADRNEAANLADRVLHAIKVPFRVDELTEESARRRRCEPCRRCGRRTLLGTCCGTAGVRFGVSQRVGTARRDYAVAVAVGCPTSTVFTVGYLRG
jgi:GGDEF domain-containing protein